MSTGLSYISINSHFISSKTHSNSIHRRILNQTNLQLHLFVLSAPGKCWQQMGVRYVSGGPAGACGPARAPLSEHPESLIPTAGCPPERPPRCPDVLALFSILGTQGRLSAG